MTDKPDRLTVNRIAKAIFELMHPGNMADRDWDSGAILGADNHYRKQINAAAHRAIKVIKDAPPPPEPSVCEWITIDKDNPDTWPGEGELICVAGADYPNDNPYFERWQWRGISKMKLAHGKEYRNAIIGIDFPDCGGKVKADE